MIQALYLRGKVLSSDIEKFKLALLRESKVAFLDIIENFELEGIYSLCLYNSGDSWSYLFPSFSTKVGLSKVASDYKGDEYYREKSLDYLENDLRWSPCDSPNHELYVSAFPESETHLEKIVKEMDQHWDNGREDKYSDINEKLVSVCISCLQQLEKDNVFSKLERGTFVLNVLNGDQSDEERLERAEKLNPSDVFLKYSNEI